MSSSTPATRALIAAGVAVDLRHYDYDPQDQQIAIQAALALGESPARVLKTLIIFADEKPGCVLVPADREVKMKKAAAAFGAKVARMATVAEAERITGYKVGGVSPFGQKKALRTFFERTVESEPYVFVNGGQRGLQLKIAVATLQAVARAEVADLTG
jgi:Cys-tRNA(Pro)/Cys-tRNA(Cys) deacylase